ncbi:hypothetical protein C8J56DRAFT_965429 [Mycena floridula]|nr:hypothetical protein C8J56DRAFT_965429 [Mycena floridula]
MLAVSRLSLFIWLLYITLVSAYPQPHLLVRDSPTVRNSSGIIQIISPSKGIIAQAPATDGSGTSFDLPALIWIGFCLGIGLPMAFAGIRGWRLTTGVGIGLSASVLAWAAFINTVDAPGIPDLVLNFIVLGFFFLGFILGLFEFARLGAIVVLCIGGGLAFGLRIVIIKDGLLFPDAGLYIVNWVIVAVLGATAGLAVIWAQRAALLFACSSVGTFLIFLGADLIMNKQAGMSRGLRLLFDQNDSHLADIVSNPYSPSQLTRIFIYASLGLTPVLALAQHKIFKQPFNRLPAPDSDSEMGETGSVTSSSSRKHRSTFIQSMEFLPPPGPAKLRGPNTSIM